MSGCAEMRQAVIEAVERAGCEPIYAEKFAASATSPRTACLDGVASCDGQLLILGVRYGDPTPSGRSATEEGYQEASMRSINIYAFVERGAREPRQNEFVSKVEDYVSGHWRKTFDSKEELARLVEESLKENPPMISDGNEEAKTSQKIDQVLDDRPPQSQGIVWLRPAMASLREDEVLAQSASQIPSSRRACRRLRTRPSRRSCLTASLIKWCRRRIAYSSSRVICSSGRVSGTSSAP